MKKGYILPRRTRETSHIPGTLSKMPKPAFKIESENHKANRK